MDKNLPKAPVNEPFTIENEELLGSLLTLAMMCAANGTDSCDLTLDTSDDKLVCHISFESSLS